MMYKKNFVAAIKVNGRILRESSDRVELPFGSEYSILLKNLDSVRSQAKISIDGQDATGWLVLQPGQDLEIERFVKNLDRGNRFKFIERTERIENHRGVKIEDGLVRIEFKREKKYELPKIVEHHTYHYDYYPYLWPRIHFKTNLTPTIYCNSVTTSGSLGGLQVQNTSFSAQNNVMRSTPENDVGITVPGSLSNQKFTLVSDFETEQSEVITLHLVGRKAEEPVRVAKTVRMKLQCETCGRKNKSNMKFCSECGTSLEKI